MKMLEVRVLFKSGKEKEYCVKDENIDYEDVKGLKDYVSKAIRHEAVGTLELVDLKTGFETLINVSDITAMAIKLAEYEDKEENREASEEVIKFLENLISDLDDIDWNISGIVEIEKINRDDKEFCKIKDDPFSDTYEKQDDEYIVQWTGYCEDDYHGIILKPLKNNKYLKISYNC